MTMIERVAKAIAKREIGYWTPEERGYQAIDLLVAQTWKDWEDVARDAIEAMREPTEGMVKAGVDFALSVSLGGDYNWAQYVIDKHRVMIDAALQEGKGMVG